MSELPNLKQVPRLTGGGDGSGSFDVMAKMVISMVDGSSTVEDIGEMCGLEGDLARKIFADLVAKRVVAFEGRDGEDDTGKERARPRGSNGESPDLESQVDELLSSVDAKNYYDLLGVAPDADRKDMRSNFFALSKKFHPDKAFGANRAQLRSKMEVAFRHISQAYETLSHAEQRREYDAYIADQIELWRIEKQLENAMGAGEKTSKREPEEKTPVSASRAQKEAVVTRSSSPVKPASDEPAVVKTSPARSGATSKGPTRRPPSSPASSGVPSRNPEHEARRDRWRRERLSRALRRGAAGSTSSSPPAAAAPDVEDKIQHARIAMEQGEFGDATDLIKKALEGKPDDKELLAMMERAKMGARKMLATGYLRQGRYEIRQGDFRKARGTLEKALEADPGNPDARHLMAEALMQLRVELPRALTICRELVLTSGQKGRYFATLGELLLLANESGQAAEAFEKAVALEPSNKDYKKRLRACKASRGH